MQVKNTLFIVLIFLGLTIYSQEIDQRIREVYAGQAEKLVDKSRLAALNDALKRVEIIVAPAHGPEKLTKLSEVALLNKYNPSLSRDEVFDPGNFNPLKYDLQFFTSSMQKYRVDGTDYVIVIYPPSN